jgi:hypothetical protein
MMFTFTFGYSLSGPVWAICKAIRKMMKEGREKRIQCQDHPL